VLQNVVIKIKALLIIFSLVDLFSKSLIALIAIHSREFLLIQIQIQKSLRRAIWWPPARLLHQPADALSLSTHVGLLLLLSGSLCFLSVFTFQSSSSFIISNDSFAIKLM